MKAFKSSRHGTRGSSYGPRESEGSGERGLDEFVGSIRTVDVIEVGFNAKQDK